MRDPGEWGYSCALPKAAELGDFTSPSGRMGAVGMLGDARPIFRPLSTVRAVVFCWVTWMQGDGGGTGFFRSQVRAGSPMSPTLFEQVHSDGSPGLHKAKGVPGGEVGSRAEVTLGESQHSPDSIPTVCSALQLALQLHDILISEKKKSWLGEVKGDPLDLSIQLVISRTKIRILAA